MRQRQHSNRRGASFVFTPQILLNGENYRRGLVFDDIESKVKAINQSRPQAQIRLSFTLKGAELSGSVEATASGQRDAQLFAALIENNLLTAVKAGENKGRSLKHDFVVRELIGPITLDAGGRARLDHSFRIGPQWKVQDLRLAAFVQSPSSGDTLQAVATGCS